MQSWTRAEHFGSGLGSGRARIFAYIYTIFTRYVLSGQNRAFNSLVGFGPGLDSKCQVRAEKKQKKTRESNPVQCTRCFVLVLTQFAFLRLIELSSG